MSDRLAFLSTYTIYLSAISLGFACDPVGEPIIRPQLYNSGKIVEPDAGYIRLDCDQSAQLPDTLSIYCFENHDRGDDIVVDSTGKHDGTIVGTKTRRVRGPTCCGMARRFSDTNTSSYIEIPDSPDWDLDEGSISFWLRISVCLVGDQNQGIISRASIDHEESGHFALVLLSECKWAAFISEGGETIAVHSEESLTPGKWSHVNVNFGPPTFELYLDGQLIAERESTAATSGNRNPWVIGADTREALPGTASPPAHFLTGAAIDLLRISATRNRLVVLE